MAEIFWQENIFPTVLLTLSILLFLIVVLIIIYKYFLKKWKEKEFITLKILPMEATINDEIEATSHIVNPYVHQGDFIYRISVYSGNTKLDYNLSEITLNAFEEAESQYSFKIDERFKEGKYKIVAELIDSTSGASIKKHEKEFSVFSKSKISLHLSTDRYLYKQTDDVVVTARVENEGNSEFSGNLSIELQNDKKHDTILSNRPVFLKRNDSKAVSVTIPAETGNWKLEAHLHDEEGKILSDDFERVLRSRTEYEVSKQNIAEVVDVKVPSNFEKDAEFSAVETEDTKSSIKDIGVKEKALEEKVKLEVGLPVKKIETKSEIEVDLLGAIKLNEETKDEGEKQKEKSESKPETEKEEPKPDSKLLKPVDVNEFEPKSKPSEEPLEKAAKNEEPKPEEENLTQPENEQEPSEEKPKEEAKKELKSAFDSSPLETEKEKPEEEKKKELTSSFSPSKSAFEPEVKEDEEDEMKTEPDKLSGGKTI